MANLLVKQGDEPGARAALTEAEKRCPEAKALALLGDLLAKAGDKEQSAQVLRRAIALDAGLARAHYRLALLLKSEGNESESKHEMELFREAKAQEDRVPKIQALRR